MLEVNLMERLRLRELDTGKESILNKKRIKEQKMWMRFLDPEWNK
jgi:hypothetical protein